MNKIVNSGKRKRAGAKSILTEGTGRVWVNGKDYKSLQFFDRLKIEEPLKITEGFLGKLNFNVDITARGGGEKGQIEAARIALTKTISEFAKSKELTEKFFEYDRNLIVADVRRKEAYKPGDSKARRKR